MMAEKAGATSWTALNFAVRVGPSLLQRLLRGAPPNPAVHSRTQELPRDCRSGFSLFFGASPIALKTQAQGSQYLVGAMKNLRDVLSIFIHVRG